MPRWTVPRFFSKGFMVGLRFFPSIACASLVKYVLHLNADEETNTIWVCG